MPAKTFSLALISVTLLMFWGCYAAVPRQNETPRQSILRQYYSRVDKSDGLTTEEARLSAQAHLLFIGQDREYDLLHPEDMTDDADTLTIRFRPINKTLQDIRRKPFLDMSVDKKTGLVRHHRVDREE